MSLSDEERRIMVELELERAEKITQQFQALQQLAQLQERRAHIEESERQIAAGRVYSEEESDAMMDQIVDQLSISIAK